MIFQGYRFRDFRRCDAFVADILLQNMHLRTRASLNANGTRIRQYLVPTVKALRYVVTASNPNSRDIADTGNLSQKSRRNLPLKEKFRDVEYGTMFPGICYMYKATHSLPAAPFTPIISYFKASRRRPFQGSKFTVSSGRPQHSCQPRLRLMLALVRTGAQFSWARALLLE